MRKTRPLVKCPQCGEVVRARHATFRHCGRQYPVESFKLQNDSLHESVGNPVESDPVKEAIAERIEKGELSGSADVMVKGVPVHVEFETEGNNPCPDSLKGNPDSGEWERVSDPYGDERTQKTWKKGDVIVRIKYFPHSRKYEVRKDDVSRDKLLASESADSLKSAMIIAERMREPDLDSLERNPKSSREPKVKVFNEKKTKKSDESEIKEAISDVDAEKKKKDEENPLCPECKVELEKVKKVEYGRGLRWFFKSNLSSDVEPYFCPKCKQLYVLRESESSDLEEGEDCPYCDEPLSKIKGSGFLYCRDCHRIFEED